ncbi:MAG: hypothetical protein GF317_09290 [Candidatus Lokiarchaeota archaeon]|nr:hypothetical protein [Candidatus Lokiarchaeota archaeon]MBD3199905.1 hypothetical protein [Candidatus Lokiarchaeota archaeon]
MRSIILPFRQQNEETPLSKIHPLARIIIPFILVIPTLLISDYFLIITILLLTLLTNLFFRLKTIKVLSTTKAILPFIIIITIFIPLYYGNTIYLQVFIGIQITIYQEGLAFAILLFLRIFTAIFVFLSYFSALSYSEFIEAITKAHLPSMFVGSIVILLHYIPILATSNRKILEAQELRGKKVTSYWLKLKAHAFIMGKSIVSNMERSEKLYESLKMRGFSGKITFAPRGIKKMDLVILFFFLSLEIIFVIIIDLETIYLGVIQFCIP